MLTLAFMVMLWPGVAYGAAPAFTSASMDSLLSDNYIRMQVHFSAGIYTNNNATGAIDASDFSVSVANNGGAVTNAIISAMNNTANNGPLEGDKDFFFFLTLTGGPPSGVETITIKPASGDAVFNSAGEAMAADASVTATLLDKRVEFAVVPLVAGDRHPGSKRVSFTVYSKGEEVTAYYIVVNQDASPPPTKAQVKAGVNYESVVVLDEGSQTGVKTNGYIINPYTELPADDTNYDVYVVIEDTVGNLSEPANITLRTPVKLLAADYPQVGTAQAAGSKQVQILNQANGDSETIYPGGLADAYYVAVANGANAPSAHQIKNGFDSTGSDALASGNVPIVTANTEVPAVITLPADATEYDVYVVLHKGYNSGYVVDIWSEVVPLDVTTPPAKPTVTRDPGNTGGAGASFDAETNTFSGTIEYYQVAEGFPPTAGNYVGVKIAAPAFITVNNTNATFKYKNQAGVETTLTGTWLDGDDFVYYYPKVTEIPQSFTVKIDWDGSDGYEEETITINVAADTVLVTPISTAAIPGVTAPVIGATPVTTITETEQFTGTVAWDPAIAAGGKFAASTIYTATITLIPQPGYILEGVGEDFFTVAGADSVTNDADSGIVTAVFPKTAAASSGGSGGGALPGFAIPTEGTTQEKYGAEVDIPRGAVSSDTRGDIDRFNSDKIDAPDDSFIPGNIFELTKKSSGDFLKPITVTLPYKQSAVDFEKYDLSIYWYDEDLEEWIELDDVEIDEDDLTVSGENEKIGYFALIATKKAVIPPVEPPVEPEPELPVLTDISGHWAKASIEHLVEMGAISGYPDNTFRPDNPITRAEFATVLVKAMGLPISGSKVFADTTGHWAKEAISTAYAAGIISGYNEQSFGPDDPITREQMAVMVVKAAGLTGTAPELKYADSQQISAWAREFVARAAAEKLITGYPDNTFRPTNKATRAEAVTVIKQKW